MLKSEIIHEFWCLRGENDVLEKPFEKMKKNIGFDTDPNVEAIGY